MAGDETTRWTVFEVHNFGGFFGSDTVTLTALRWDDRSEDTITIDEQALANMPDRHKVAPAMVFDLLLVGDCVDHARLVGAAEWPLLDAALDPSPDGGPLPAPRVRAYRCARCELWVVGEPFREGSLRRCRLCGNNL